RVPGPPGRRPRRPYTDHDDPVAARLFASRAGGVFKERAPALSRQPPQRRRTVMKRQSNLTRVLPSCAISLLALLLTASYAQAHLSIIRQGLESRGALESGDRLGTAVAAGDFN